jgi:peptidoglycan hydrolase CwlO-like protein
MRFGTWTMIALFALFSFLTTSCKKEEAQKPPAEAAGQASQEETKAFAKMIEGKLTDLDKNLSSLDGKMDNLKEKKAELKAKLDEVKKKRAEVGKKLSELTTDLVQQKALKTLLDELMDMYQKLAPMVE